MLIMGSKCPHCETQHTIHRARIAGSRIICTCDVCGKTSPARICPPEYPPDTPVGPIYLPQEDVFVDLEMWEEQDRLKALEKSK